ncbi:MAG: hypothetical protein QME05_03545 [Candidatus Margulisbacteria bacterium]|nr:hypothetical protein [Candidatus Margulisiibacteriota bacterium]
MSLSALSFRPFILLYSLVATARGEDTASPPEEDLSLPTEDPTRDGYFERYGAELADGNLILLDGNPKQPRDRAVSEGIGFGALIAARTNRAEDQQRFWAICQARQTYFIKDTGVMRWIVGADGHKLDPGELEGPDGPINNPDDSAADGDQDFIAAEITAYHKMESGDWEIPAGMTLDSFKADIKADLTAFWDAYIHTLKGPRQRHILTSSDGSWDGSPGDLRYVYSPSYADPHFLQMFAEFDTDPDHAWSGLIADIMNLNAQILEQHDRLGAVGQNPMPAKVFVSVSSLGNFVIEKEPQDSEYDSIRFLLRMSRFAILDKNQPARQLLAQLTDIAGVSANFNDVVIGEKRYSNTLTHTSYGIALWAAGKQAEARQYFDQILLHERKADEFGQYFSDSPYSDYYSQSLIQQSIDLYSQANPAHVAEAATALASLPPLQPASVSAATSINTVILQPIEIDFTVLPPAKEATAAAFIREQKKLVYPDPNTEDYRDYEVRHKYYKKHKGARDRGEFTSLTANYIMDADALFWVYDQLSIGANPRGKNIQTMISNNSDFFHNWFMDAVLIWQTKQQLGNPACQEILSINDYRDLWLPALSTNLTKYARPRWLTTLILRLMNNINDYRLLKVLLQALLTRTVAVNGMAALLSKEELLAFIIQILKDLGITTATLNGSEKSLDQLTPADLNQLIEFLSEQSIAGKIAANGLSSQAKMVLLPILQTYYGAHATDKKEEIDPLLVVEIMMGIAFVDPAQAVSMLEQAEAQLIEFIRSTEPNLRTALNKRAKTEKEKAIIRANGDARRLLAQIYAMQAGKETSAKAKCEKLVEAYRRAEAAYRLLDGIGQQSAQQMQAEILIRQADLVKYTDPTNATPLYAQARVLIEALNVWYTEYLAAIKKLHKNAVPSPWLQQIHANTVISEVKLDIYANESFSKIDNKSVQLKLSPQQTLSLGKEIALFYLTLNDFNDPQKDNCRQLAEKLLKNIDETESPLLYIEAQLWLAKIINADANRESTELLGAETLLSAIIAAKKTEATKELDDRVIDEARVALAESLIRQAYLHKEATEPDKYQNKAQEAIDLLAEVIQNTKADEFTRTTAKIWLVKIVMSLLGDKKDAKVPQINLSIRAALDALGVNTAFDSQTDESGVLQELAAILTDCKTMLGGGMLADVERLLGENYLRQVYILQNLADANKRQIQELLTSAETSLKVAQDSGGVQTRFQANLWLAKLEKEKLSQEIRQAKDEKKALTPDDHITKITEYLAAAEALVKNNTPEYADWQLAQGDFLLQRAFLAKDAGKTADFTQLAEEAKNLLEAAALEGESTKAGSFQTRAEANLALVGLTLATAEDNTAELEAAWKLLEEICKLVDFKGGQSSQLLKQIIECGSRLCLAYRDQGKAVFWRTMYYYLMDLVVEDTMDAANDAAFDDHRREKFMADFAGADDPDLTAHVYFWLGQLRLAHTFGTKRRLAGIRDKFLLKAKDNLAGDYAVRYGTYSQGQRQREIDLTEVRIYSARGQVHKAKEILEALLSAQEARPEAARSADDWRFLTQIAVDLAEIYDWGTKNFVQAEKMAAYAENILSVHVTHSTSPQIKILQWRAELVNADILLHGSVLHGGRRYAEASAEYTRIAQEIETEIKVNYTDTPTITLRNLLVKTYLGVSEAYLAPSSSRDAVKAGYYARQAAQLCRRITELNPDTKDSRRQARQARLRQADTGNWQVSTSVSHYTGTAAVEDQLSEARSLLLRAKVRANITGIIRSRKIKDGPTRESTAGGINVYATTEVDKIDDSANGRVGGEVDVYGVVQAGGSVRPTDNPVEEEAYFQDPRASVSAAANLDQLTRGIAPVDGNVTANFEDGHPGVDSYFWQVNLHPFRWLPASWQFPSLVDFTPGYKQYIDRYAPSSYYNEKAFTLDLSLQVKQALRLQYGVDIPGPRTQYFDNLDHRFSLLLRPLPRKLPFLNIMLGGEYSRQDNILIHKDRYTQNPDGSVNIEPYFNPDRTGSYNGLELHGGVEFHF